MPSIDDRLKKRVLWIGSDQELVADARSVLPEGWQLNSGGSLGDFGEWQDILLYRFLVLDLDAELAEDPVEIVDTVRREYQINIPIFCYGGRPDQRAAARSAGADRFFERSEILLRLQDFVRQFGW